MINKRLLKTFDKAFPSIRKNVLFQWLALLASCCSTFALSAMLAMAIAGNFSFLFAGTLTVLLALAFRMRMNRLAQMASLQASTTVKEEMRHALYDKLVRLGSSCQAKWSSSEISQLTTEGVEQLETYFGQYVPQLFYALLAPVTLFFALCLLSWKAALVLLVCVPLIPVSIVAVQKFAKKLLSRYWDQYTGLSDGFLENLNALTTLKLYGTDELYHEKMNVQAENFRRITMRVLIMQLNSISVMDLVAYGGSALGMLVALHSLLSGSVSLFGFLSIVLLSAEFFLPMRTLGSYFHISMNGSAAADKMFAILDEPVLDGEQAVQEKSTGFQADHLSFAYPGSERLALKDVSFETGQSGLVGIVGESGSGKSTLAALLCGRVRGYFGSLCLGSQEVSVLKKESLAKTIGLLGAHSELFAGSVADNLRAANLQAADETLIAALRKTQIWEWLQENGGLEFRIEEEAKNLSGGQKQRIAFARLLVQDPKILLLDEATSSVDAESEALLVEQIEELAKSRLVLFITHRLANVKHADHILVLRDGVLEESGTQTELLEKAGEYARLHQAQQALEAYVQLSPADDEEKADSRQKDQTKNKTDLDMNLDTNLETNVKTNLKAKFAGRPAAVKGESYA